MKQLALALMVTAVGAGITHASGAGPQQTGTRQATASDAQEFTRGIGVYPGDPREDFGPTLRPDPATYRNLALHRPALQSSAYDYNLTAQLVTDGIVATALPFALSTATSQHGALKKQKREWLVDGNWVSGVELKGPGAWVQVAVSGGEEMPEIDRVSIEGYTRPQSEGPENWTCQVLGSDDGREWTEVGRASGMARPGGYLNPSIPLRVPGRHRAYRFVFSNPRAVGWFIGELRFHRADREVRLSGPHHFTSAWMSAGTGQEWVSVDLGAPSTFDRVALKWLRRPAEATVQASDDGVTWRAVTTLPAPAGANDDLKLARPARGRHVRVLMTKAASPAPYVLTELEVHGRGGLVPEAKPAPPLRADGRLDLAGGAWRLQRDSLVTASGADLSTVGYRDEPWVIATVPGTTLTSYHNAGALPDPNFGDNQLAISDSFFYADFWYRTEFVAPASEAGRRTWLNFDGVNWKAEIFLNGQPLGRLDGAFARGRFDVTDRVRPGARNALAVRIEKNATPGSVKEKTYENPDKNGGALGSDNPTYHASIGWDWIPTIRGRNTGIWNDVYLTSTGAVTIEDPFVSTTMPLPDTSSADVLIAVSLKNHGATPVSGRLRGRFGDVAFETPVTIAGGSATSVDLTPETHPALRLQAPRLWWPVGYGEPHLYDVELSFVPDGAGSSDTKAFKSGVRQFTWNHDDGTLRMWINGRRFIPKGGNWGFGESMLRYRGREYDVAVRYHRDMHFNMIRNWVGQIGDDEFYEACDRHGVVVWQDFWLANPWDGGDPDSDPLFLANAADTIRRIRNHPSVGLYCGRNEGYPPRPVDDAIRTMLSDMHPGLGYISSSADDVASGHGPYRAMPFDYYFTERATPKFHSEMGMPNIVTMDSLKLMMPASVMWPQGRMWGLHDFCLGGAQGGASYLERIRKSYGQVTGVEEWVGLAQFVNYEGYRAMFEAQSRNRMGLLIWMSHPAWPSFVWQTYDYYFEPTAAYFGAKKASEPLHIQWNPVTNMVEVVNYSGGDQEDLTATLQVINADGSVQAEQAATVDSPEDSVATPFAIEFPTSLTPLHFLRLRLTRGETLVSDNFYWRGLDEGDTQEIRDLPKVAIEAATTVTREGDDWRLTTRLRNTSSTPALMVRLKVVRDRTGDRILPALYGDNYVALMPGEERTIATEVRQADTRGEAPRMEVEGFNVGQVVAPAAKRQ